MHIFSRMLTLALLAYPALHVSAQTQGRGDQAVFACISPELLQCGCFIRLQVPRCSNQAFSSQPHLFTELQLNAPIWISVNGQERSLPQVLQTGTPAKEDSSQPSRSIYRDEELEVDVRYRPAPSTCPASKVDGCEFTDVTVLVSIKQRGKKPTKYKGSGTCGC